jgi:hypothetical protein
MYSQVAIIIVIVIVIFANEIRSRNIYLIRNNGRVKACLCQVVIHIITFKLKNCFRIEL